MPLPSVNKAAHSGFETQRRHHRKSKTGVSVAPQKDLCPTRILKEILTWCHNFYYWLCILFVQQNTSLSFRTIE